MAANDVHAAIVDELHRAFEDLAAEPELLGALRAWRAELSDQEILERLRRLNDEGTTFDRIIQDPT